MRSRHFLYLGLLLAALMLAACTATAPQASEVQEVTTAPQVKAAPPTDIPRKATIVQVPPPTLSEWGVSVGFTEDGVPYRGNPNAPVTLMEHSDFQ